MIRKANCVLALILVVLALGACGKKEEAQPQTAAPAVEKPKVVPGEMVLIPAGEYIIGTNEPDPENKKAFSNAYPEHKVKLAAFWIDKYEVTGKEYLDFSINTSYVAEGEAEGKTWRTFSLRKRPTIPSRPSPLRMPRHTARPGECAFRQKKNGKQPLGDQTATVFHGATNGNQTRPTQWTPDSVHRWTSASLKVM